MKLKYNLQFFAEENNNGDDNSGNSGNDNDTNNSNDDSNSGNTGTGSEDIAAFAEIISDKDKQIEQLQKDVAELKRSNASLLVKVNAGTGSAQPKSFEENLLSLVGAKPRKE